MVISTAHLSPLLSILFGILILIFPRLLNYLVAVYLILAGLLGIGLIGRPLRAHAQFDQAVPAATAPACRPPADLDVSLGPRTSPPVAGRSADRPRTPLEVRTVVSMNERGRRGQPSEVVRARSGASRQPWHRSCS